MENFNTFFPENHTLYKYFVDLMDNFRKLKESQNSKKKKLGKFKGTK